MVIICGIFHHFTHAEATIHELDDNKCDKIHEHTAWETLGWQERKKELPYNCLETRVQLCQEGGLVLQCQHSFLHHGALHIIILDHHVLFQDFDGIELLRALPVCQHHLQGGETAE